MQSQRSEDRPRMSPRQAPPAASREPRDTGNTGDTRNTHNTHIPVRNLLKPCARPGSHTATGLGPGPRRFGAPS